MAALERAPSRWELTIEQTHYFTTRPPRQTGKSIVGSHTYLWNIHQRNQENSNTIWPEGKRTSTLLVSDIFSHKEQRHNQYWFKSQGHFVLLSKLFSDEKSRVGLLAYLCHQESRSLSLSLSLSLQSWLTYLVLNQSPSQVSLLAIWLAWGIQPRTSPHCIQYDWKMTTETFGDKEGHIPSCMALTARFAVVQVDVHMSSQSHLTPLVPNV